MFPDKFVLPYCKMGRKFKAKKVATPGSGVGVHKGSPGRPRKMKKTTIKMFKWLGYSKERLDDTACERENHEAVLALQTL